MFLLLFVCLALSGFHLQFGADERRRRLMAVPVRSQFWWYSSRASGLIALRTPDAGGRLK
jgi:hypothetical protein